MRYPNVHFWLAPSHFDWLALCILIGQYGAVPTGQGRFYLVHWSKDKTRKFLIIVESARGSERARRGAGREPSAWGLPSTECRRRSWQRMVARLILFITCGPSGDLEKSIAVGKFLPGVHVQWLLLGCTVWAVLCILSPFLSEQHTHYSSLQFLLLLHPLYW